MTEVTSLDARKAYGAIYEAILQACKEMRIDEEAAAALAVRSLEILQGRTS